MRRLVLIAAAVVAIFSASIARAADITAVEAQQFVRTMANSALAIAADKTITDGVRDERFCSRRPSPSRSSLSMSLAAAGRR